MLDSSLYPLARKDESVVCDFHGTKVPDPFRYLEDPDGKETEQFVAELNKISKPFLASCEISEKIKKRLTEMMDYPKYTNTFKKGNHYFYSYNSGLQNQNVFYIQTSLKDPGKPFIDPNKWSEDGTTALTSKAFTDDGTLLAYCVSEKGSDWATIKFKKVPSGDDLPDVLKNVKFTSLCWTEDKKGIFYNMFFGQSGQKEEAEQLHGRSSTKHEHHSLYYHRLGTPQSEDVMVVHFKDNPDYMVHAQVTEDGRYLVVGVDKGCDPENLLFYADLRKENLQGQLKLIPIVDKFKAKFDYIENFDSKFVIQTDEGAPMYKLMEYDVEDPSSGWKTLLAERKDAKLDWCYVVNESSLITAYMRDVKIELHVYNARDGAHVYQVPIEIGTVSNASGMKKHTEAFFKFESFTTPGRFYRIDFSKSAKPTPELVREIHVPGYVSEDFSTEQVFYESKDGTRVPMFIFHKKDFSRNGDNPMILYGYGGFDISLLPYFSASRIMFLRHFDGAFAVANLRGGSEYGKSWHEGGMRARKQNVFDDFIHAAKYLVANQYTQTKRLAIQGGSNGGLLVAACAQQEPSLFGAVVNQVGVLDMLRFHKFTIGSAWVPEYGSPEVPEDFPHIFRYSPLHNVRAPGSPESQYPPMMLLSADHDDRVVPSHTLKYMAALYHAVHGSPHQKNPVIARIETKAGHGAGKPISKVIEELTDVYSFLVRVLKLKWRE